MFYYAQKRTNYCSKIRKKAPKVPDITCPAIDDVLNKLEKAIGKEFKDSKFRMVERKMEKLRKENERLLVGGSYWLDACIEAGRDLLGMKKTR